MSQQSVRARYIRDSVITASPARLLVMLYDALVKDLRQAEKALETNNLAVVNEKLLHAQEIVFELSGSLRPELWSGGTSLAQIYDYILRQLREANIQKDPEKIKFCRDLIEPLQSAWREAAQETDTGRESQAVM